MNKSPTDDWLRIKGVRESTEGDIVNAQLYQKENVIVKLTIGPSNEYNIYKLLSKLQFHHPCIPKVYGVISCFERKKYIEDNFAKLINKRTQRPWNATRIHNLPTYIEL